MNKLNRFRPRPWHLISYEGHSFLITDLEGFAGGGIEGFYYRQTRFLSKMRLAVCGEKPAYVSANAVDAYSSIAYYLAPSSAGSTAEPQPQGGNDGSEIVRHGIELQINRYVGGGLHLDIYVANHALAPANIELYWHFDADFADRAEAEQGERQQSAPVECRWQPGVQDAKLSFHYGHPQLSHTTELRFSGLQDVTERDGVVSHLVQLSPQQPVTFSIDIVPIFCGEEVPLRHGRDTFGRPANEVPSDGAMRMSAGNALVQRVWDRAVSDLASLALLDGEGEERLTPAGGVPKYLALFGRDVLMTGFQTSLLAPAVLRGSLRQIAQWNATEYDERYDQEPGRVIHQRELGPLALLGKNPFLHYYGDYSAPGLFLLDMAWDLALTGDKDFFRSMQDKVLATLEWMDRDGDGDGDGFTNTRRRPDPGARRTRAGRIPAKRSFTRTAGSSRTRLRWSKSRAVFTRQNSFWGSFLPRSARIAWRLICWTGPSD